MAYRAIEKVSFQAADGTTGVLHPGDTTDDQVLALHAPESFEDTELENKAADGTSPAEQLGLDAQGGVPEQGKLNRELVEQASTVHNTGVFASSRLADPGKAELTTSGGAELGSDEDAEDIARFAKAQREADEAAAKRAEDTAAANLEATQAQDDATLARNRGVTVDPTAKPSARAGAKTGGA